MRNPKNVATRPVDVANLTNISGKVRPAATKLLPKPAPMPFNAQLDWTGVTFDMLRDIATDAIVVRLQGRTRTEHTSALAKNKAAKFDAAVSKHMSGRINVLASIINTARGNKPVSEKAVARANATVLKNMDKLSTEERAQMLARLTELAKATKK